MDYKEFFKLSSILLMYPQEDIYYSLKDYEPVDIYDERFIDFLNFYKNTPLQELQEEYVRSFDFNKDGTLYLTYHRFKDDVQRGSFLAKLIDYYRKKGFEFAANELPDFFPVILEFISEIDLDTGIKVLQNFEKEIETISKSLDSLGSPYGDLIDSILEMTKNREVK